MKYNFKHLLIKLVYKASLILPLPIFIYNVPEKKTLGETGFQWTYFSNDELEFSTIVSAGLGENGTFEFDFLRVYKSNIVIIDPTPRAIEYFNNYLKHASIKDVLNIESLHLVPKALAFESGIKSFLAPINSSNVSYSLIRSNLDISKKDYLTVSVVTINDIIKQFNLTSNEFKLLKLDIEGAEYQLLMGIESWQILPNQILVEFDFLKFSIIKSRLMLVKINLTLQRVGYVCVNKSDGFNFLYVKKHILNRQDLKGES
jgi:FkbM family methyltransferase